MVILDGSLQIFTLERKSLAFLNARNESSKRIVCPTTAAPQNYYSDPSGK